MGLIAYLKRWWHPSEPDWSSDSYDDEPNEHGDYFRDTNPALRDQRPDQGQ